MEPRIVTDRRAGLCLAGNVSRALQGCCSAVDQAVDKSVGKVKAPYSRWRESASATALSCRL